MDLQMKIKRPPLIIDPPLKPHVVMFQIAFFLLIVLFFQDHITVTSPNGTSHFEPIDECGPDPSRSIPPPGKRRVHFADDKGEKLVHEKLIEMSPPYRGNCCFKVL